MLKRATMNRDTCHASSWISSILATLPSSSCFKLPESSHEQQYEKPRRRGSLRFFQSLRCDHGHDFSGLFGVALRVRRVSATRTTIMSSRQDALHVDETMCPVQGTPNQAAIVGFDPLPIAAGSRRGRSHADGDRRPRLPPDRADR